VSVIDARFVPAPAPRPRRLRWLRRQDDGPPQDRLEVQRGWFEAQLAGWPGWSGMSPQVAERVSVANRCMQLNAQQIAGMTLRFSSTAPAGGREPAWLGNPDPVWFPNGIGDAVFCAIWSMYSWGDAFLYITSRYADGYPSGWTVLDPSTVSVQAVDGRRVYRVSDQRLDPDDVVQVTRDPRGGLRGTSALRAYAPYVQGLMAAAATGATMTENPIPNAILKSEQKLTAEQAADLQAQWTERAGLRRGAPAILPPKLDFEMLQFSPADLQLIEVQEWDTAVIAAAYGVPLIMLNMTHKGSLVYQNPQMLGEFWWRFELRPTGKRLSDALSLQMLPAGNEVFFDAGDTFAPLSSPVPAPPTPVGAATPTADDATPVIPLRPVQEGL
jgi:HK97 family phage portal protein